MPRLRGRGQQGNILMHTPFLSALYWRRLTFHIQERSQDDVPGPILSPAHHGLASEARSTTSSTLLWVQFGLGAVLPHSNTPSLRVVEFEDEDDDEDEYDNEYEARTLTPPLPLDRLDLDTSCPVLRQRWRSFRVRPAGEPALRA